MALITGRTVVLYQNEQTGVDPFNAPTFEEVPVEVGNVLISPADASDVVTDLQLYGKRAEYVLCIPKGDTHDWMDKRVEFFGHSWRTFGIPQEWQEELLPLDWNKKVKVERYE